MTKPLRLRAAAIALALASAGIAAIPAQAAIPAGCGGRPTDTWVNVVVEGVRNSNGLVAITLYADNKSRFLVRHGSLDRERVPARAGSTQACLFVPGPGVYAIAVYHDENASRKLDRSGLGLPEEGFGFSNNPSTLLGIPAFRSVRVNVPRANLGVRIRLRYP